MTLTPSRAEAMLDRRNRCFMEANMDDYLEMWVDDCTVEVLIQRSSSSGPDVHATSVRLDRAALEQAVGEAWRERDVLLMETRAFALHGQTLFNEFSIVWEVKADRCRTLQTGVGVIEVAADGRWRSLRDHYDSTGSSMQSALGSSAVSRALGSGRV